MKFILMDFVFRKHMYELKRSRKWNGKKKAEGRI